MSNHTSLAGTIAERAFPGARGDAQRRTALRALIATALSDVERIVNEEWWTAIRAAGGDRVFWYQGKTIDNPTPAEAVRLLFRRAYSLGHNDKA